jgi:hypothetical protein
MSEHADQFDERDDGTEEAEVEEAAEEEQKPDTAAQADPALHETST